MNLKKKNGKPTGCLVFISTTDLILCVVALVAVSEMSHEGVTHRPVEMLPLICSRDQRKAAKLQVRDHAALWSCWSNTAEVKE